MYADDGLSCFLTFTTSGVSPNDVSPDHHSIRVGARDCLVQLTANMTVRYESASPMVPFRVFLKSGAVPRRTLYL